MSLYTEPQRLAKKLLCWTKEGEIGVKCSRCSAISSIPMDDIKWSGELLSIPCSQSHCPVVVNLEKDRIIKMYMKFQGVAYMRGEVLKSWQSYT